LSPIVRVNVELEVPIAASSTSGMGGRRGRCRSRRNVELDAIRLPSSTLSSIVAVNVELGARG